MKRRVCVGVIAAAGVGAAVSTASAVSYLGPSSYLQFADSPFYPAYTAAQFSYFHLEDFEDGALSTPGVTSTPAFVAAPGSATDSVDADDGLIDGSGAGGHSLEFFTGTITFTFNGGALGGLPTHVGLVWTDVGFTGFDNISLEAFDTGGNSLGVFGPWGVGDGNVFAGTAEDRFLGAVDLGGISMVSMHVTHFDTEMDHLQYGRLLPAPGVGAMMALGGMMAVRRRR